MNEILDVSSNAVGIRINGKITDQDMKTIIQACTDKMDTHDRIAIYVEIIKMEGISFNAFIEDLKFGLPNLKRFSKKAVVSDKKWHETLIKIGDKIVPSIEVRYFAPDDKEAALNWVKE